MKTIGYKDRIENKTIMGYTSNKPYDRLEQLDLIPVKIKKNKRIADGLKEIKGLGNIHVYLIKGNKTRYLFSRGY